MQKQARNTSDLKRKKDGPAAAMLSTGLSAWPRDLRILQNKKTRRRQHGTVVWRGVDAAQEESVPGGLRKLNFPPLEDAEQNNLRSGQQCDIKLTHLIVIMGRRRSRLSRLIVLTLLSRRMERITEMEGVIGIWQR